MKRSDQPTDYIFLRVRTNSEWESCEFILIHNTPDWIETIYKRLRMVLPFNDDPDFKSHAYWDWPMGYYDSPADMDEYLIDLILKKDENWAFVLLDAGEPDNFPPPSSPLDTHQFIISKDGTATYKAYGKYTGDQYWSSEFDVADLLSKTLNKKP